MFQNYFKTTYRHLLKSKVNFGFKLGGLTLALFSFLVIAIYVSYQLSFDHYHDDSENIYRVISERKENGQIEKFAIAPVGLLPLLQQEFPEIASTARIRYANGTYLGYNNQLYECEGLVVADSSLFDVLTFQFIKGNADALKKSNSMVLTRTKAMAIFGSTDVLQKVLTINNNKTLYEVTAVIEDAPLNSHLFLSAIVPIHENHELTLSSIVDPVEFVDHSAISYVRFSTSFKSSFNSKVESLLDRYILKAARAENGFAISFQPIQDIHLGSEYRYEYSNRGSSAYVYAFSTLGILLLIVAGINYTNLSIADFTGRSKETGIRKVLGARKIQLISQTIIETLVLSLFSLMLGLGLLYLLFPKVAELLDPDLQLKLLWQPQVLAIAFIGLFALIFFTTIVPARLATTSGISQNLKGKGTGYNSMLSQTLMFAQFAIAAICLCCTITVGNQIKFIHSKELGFDRNNLMVFSLPENFTVDKMKVLKQELKQIQGVTGVSNSSFRIGGGYWKDWYVEDKDGMKHVELYEVFTDDELFSTLKIKLLDGRTFNSAMPSDSGAAFVINETAARELGWKEPIGKRIYTHPEEKGNWDGTVVGVVSDINISPLYDKVRPLVMRLPWQNEYPDAFVYVKYQGDAQTIASAVEKKYKATNPGYPFSFRYVDELFNSSHQKENKVFASLQFASYTIELICVLGIFSMAAFISIKRTKEFGIRKVLGASVKQIASLHIGYFIRLVLIANILILPFAYWLLKEGLNSFAYRVDLSGSVFVMVLSISVIMVILSACYSAWKAGRMNPIDVIKME